MSPSPQTARLPSLASALPSPPTKADRDDADCVVKPEDPSDERQDLVALRPLVRAVVAKTLRARPYDAIVEETTQEALTEILAALPGRRGAKVAEDGGTALRSFVVAVAANCARDAVRGLSRQRSEEPFEAATLATSHPEASLAARSSLRSVGEKIAKLPEGQRRAFLGFFVEEKSYEALADEFAVPIGTIATWIFRAKSALADESLPSLHAAKEPR